VASKKLKNNLKISIKEKVNNEMIINSLLDFFLSLFGDYRKFMNYSEQYKKKILNIDSFINSKNNKKDSDFWNTFRNTQMLERFSVERESFDDFTMEEGIFEIKSKNY
jgi:hypothetical protein